MQYKSFVLPCSILLLVACSPQAQEYTTSDVPNAMPVAVDVEKPSPAVNLSSRGLITTKATLEICSRITEQVASFNLVVGQKVSKGQVLVVLDSSRMKDRINVGKAELEKADNKYKSILVGLGYKLEQLDAVPEAIQEQARINSGYNEAMATLQMLEHELEYCQITSPFTGSVSKVLTTQYATATAGTPLIEIIDTEHLQVSFELLESELSKYAPGTELKVTTVAFPDEVHRAVVSSISPVINDNGMAHIDADLNYHTHLMPGQSAIISL